MDDYVWIGTLGIYLKLNEINDEYLTNIVNGLCCMKFNSKCFFRSPECFEKLLTETYRRRLISLNKLYRCRTMWMYGNLSAEEYLLMKKYGVELVYKGLMFDVF